MESSCEWIGFSARFDLLCDSGRGTIVSMILTLEQRNALARGGNVHLTVDGLDCVVLRSDIFERVSQILGEDWTHEELRLALARSSEGNGWDEPEMAVYDQYP